MRNEFLVEMPEDVTEYFCEVVLKRDWPNSIHAYHFIKNAIAWRHGRRTAFSCYRLFYLPDDIENGTFFGFLSRPERDYPEIIVTYTSPGNEEQFQRVLISTHIIKWGSKPLFQAIPSTIKNIIHTAIDDKGMKGKLYSDAVLKWMPADVAAGIDYEVPSDVYIDQLSVEHIEQIYSLWAHSDVYPKSDLWDTVRLNIGLGVFSRDSRQLLAWAMCGSYGGLCTLIVEPNYRGRGLGKLIVLAVTKEMGQSGIAPHALINMHNNLSLSLFKSVGYTKLPKKFPYILVADPDTSNSSDSSGP